jgi:hypothetical protein
MRKAKKFKDCIEKIQYKKAEISDFQCIVVNDIQNTNVLFR